VVKQKRWTKEEEEFVRKNYKYMTAKEIADVLGRSVSSVQHKARRMQLRVGSGNRRAGWSVRALIKHILEQETR